MGAGGQGMEGFWRLKRVDGASRLGEGSMLKAAHLAQPSIETEAAEIHSTLKKKFWVPEISALLWPKLFL